MSNPADELWGYAPCCTELALGWPKIENGLKMAAMNGTATKTLPILFCPWCGAKLSDRPKVFMLEAPPIIPATEKILRIMAEFDCGQAKQVHSKELRLHLTDVDTKRLERELQLRPGSKLRPGSIDMNCRIFGVQVVSITASATALTHQPKQEGT